MEIDERRPTPQDSMNGCQSLAINYQSCSQSQKMSIGIVGDSLAKPHSGSMKEAEVLFSHANKGVHSDENLMRRKNVMQRVSPSGIENINKADSQGGLPKVITGSLVQNLRTKDSAHNEYEESRAAAFSFAGVGNGINGPTTTNSSHPFADGIVFGYKQTECDRISLRKGGQKDLNSGRLQESLRAVVQEACVPDKGVTHKEPHGDVVSKEALRMKLLETLKTVPSENMQFVNSQTAAVAATDIEQDQIHKFHARLKNRPSSDSVKVDSENPKFAIKRRMTHSLSRGKSIATGQPIHLKNKAISDHKEGHQDDSILFFQEKSLSAEPDAATGGCLISKTKNDRKGSVIKASGLLFLSKDMNIELETCKSKKPSIDEEISLDARTSSHWHSRQNENLETEIGMQQKDFYCSYETKEKPKPGDVDSTASPDNTDHPKSFSSHSPVAVHDDMKRKLFKIKRTVLSNPLCFFPQIREMQHQIHRLPHAEREFVFRGKFELKSSQNPSPDNSDSSTRNVKDGSSQPSKTPLSTSVPSIGEEDSGDGRFAQERRGSDIIEEGPSAEQAATLKRPYKDHAEEFHTPPETAAFVKPIPSHTRRRRTREGRRNTNDRLQETSEQCLEDAVSLLGLALERVKCKMMEVTNRRCSNILVSASEEVRLQLHNAEFVIQKDMLKLASLNKSKRKCLETRLQEQRDQLKLMHEKFKQQITRFMEDYRSTVGMLGAQQMELKGAVEEQRASHRKLLSQLEEEIGMHLNDAKRRIKSVRKMRKEKMQQYKIAVAECLNDVISS